MIQSTAPTNRLALFSFLLAFLTILSFCIGLAPIPLTAWVCYPAAVLFGLTAIGTGLTGLRQVRSSAEKGRAIALIGIWTGVLTIFGVLFFTAITAILVYYGVSSLNTLWPRITP